MAIFHKGKFELYVRNEDVTKDMQIPVGTQLFLRGERGAPPFTRVEEDDEPELLRIGPGWSTVYLEKMGVGFVRRADLGLPSGRTERPPAQIPQGARQSDPPPPRPEPLRQVETVRTPPAPDAPADPRSSEAIPRRLEGIVEEVRRHPFRQPLYPYHLVDQRGRRLAYLDLQALLPTTPPESFLGRWVSVRGLLNTEGDRNERVLRVESMRFLP
ncbi:MAG: hypothetical protein EA425_09860 [Puniceicoccaceae bacterium]|nr:MAG: hypothetical protein EA425_09860 [Puniceicoccaceae bacterium]